MGLISPVLVIIGFIGIISIVVLVIQTAIDDSRIVFVILAGQMVAFLLATPGTNGAFLIGALLTVAVIMLMAPVVFRNIQQPRIWAPLLGMVASTICVVTLLPERVVHLLK
jgi:hypothetical protein